MYIACHKCAAAYSVDEKLLSGRARTQCPNCLHVQNQDDLPGLQTTARGQAALQSDPFAAAAGSAFRIPSIAPVAPPLALLDLSVDVPLVPRKKQRPERPEAPARRELRPPPNASVGASAHDVQAPRRRGERHDHGPLFNGERGQSGWRRRVLGALVLVALVMTVGVLLLSREPTPVEAAPAPVAVRLEEPWETIRHRWSPKFRNLAGAPLKLLKQGELELARDTSASYAQAEKNFQKAFLLNPESDAAVAGYVQASCLGRGNTMSDQEYQDASRWIAAAEKRSHRAPRVVIAHATLLLMRASAPGIAQRARVLSEEALGSAVGKDRAVAYLALGRAFLPTSAELAIQNIEQALKLDPLLRRAYYYRAVAREVVGDYRGAIADLEKRLSMDADQSDAVGALARIYQEAGDPGRAHQIYAQAHERSPRDVRSAMGAAVIWYQSERKPEAAAIALSELLKNRGKYRSEELLELLVHLATAQRLAEKAEAAAHSAREALKVSEHDAAAHLQLFLLALERGAPAEAARELPYLKQRLDDPGLEKLLEGRLLLAQANPLEAAKRFAESAEIDARRVDALLLAGAAAATAGRRDAAFQYLVKAGQMDPTRLGPQHLSTRFYVPPEGLLAGAEGRVIRLTSGALDVGPKLYEGLIRFHQRDFASADRLLREAVDIDVGNALAHSLRALISLQRNALRAAKSSAERAVRTGRALALAHYAYGAVLARTGALKQARRELREAEVLSPSLLATQVALAEVEARSKDVASARSRLVHVLRVDPTYLPAKRALFSLER
jgi:Tfp pilus assembly protein PilF